jgi:hypothetical protein
MSPYPCLAAYTARRLAEDLWWASKLRKAPLESEKIQKLTPRLSSCSIPSLPVSPAKLQPDNTGNQDKYSLPKLQLLGSQSYR